MIKRTLYFGNEAYLSTKDEQLVVNFPDKEKPRSVATNDIFPRVDDKQLKSQIKP